MKQKINIDKYIGRDGKYKLSRKRVFKQAFTFLFLKHVNMLMRINHINKLCFQHTKKWKKERNRWNNTNYEFSFLQEELIYHIRRAVDDMISIVWLHNEFENRRYINKVMIDSIAKYLKQRNREMICFDECLEFLNNINIISNSYKHSVHQDIEVLLSKKEPGFFIHAYPQNDYRQDENRSFYGQSELLEEFEKMFTIYTEIMYENVEKSIYTNPKYSALDILYMKLVD